MIGELNPALILILGGAVLPLLPRASHRWVIILLPVLGLLQLIALPFGTYGEFQLFGQTLTPMRIDALALPWAVIFHIAAFLGALYSWHEEDTLQYVSTLIYAGAAIGAVLAGDLGTLFVYWELTAIASVFLIWARRTESALKVGVRYLIIQVGSGVLLLAGLLIRVQETGSLDFGNIGLDSAGGLLIFLAFGIKCAFPLLHNWLQDSYPEATVSGTVILSAFTTKLAVYALARGFAGTEILIVIGATMTAFPIFFAVIENDLRRVLAYSLNNQLGFMVVGVGIGTEMALNGTAGHAFAHIIYKALLFMSMGAVLHRVGTIKASELGGLYKSMPKTAFFCIIGAMSISAFPLFSGFVTKSMILTAAAEEHLWLTWLVLMFASAGVMDHSGIKIPFFSFFAHDSGKRCEEAPTHMLWAMGIAAFLCIAIGIFPQPLYAILPYAVDYSPYTPTHVIGQLQLLMFSALAFVMLFRTGLYPPEIRGLNLDSDWLYRKVLPAVLHPIVEGIASGRERFEKAALSGVSKALKGFEKHYGTNGIFARTASTNSMALAAIVLLGAYLLFYLF